MTAIKCNARGSGEDTDGTTNIIDSFIEENRFHEQTHNLKCHLKVIKWVGVVILLFVSTSIPGFMILTGEKSHQPDGLDYKIETQHNETACVFIKQYDIYQDTYVTVCNRYGVVVIDIRRFYNDTASIIGIQLSERQWLRLKQLSPLVDKAISEARTYWKDLKILKYNPGN